MTSVTEEGMEKDSQAPDAFSTLARPLEEIVLRCRIYTCQPASREPAHDAANPIAVDPVVLLGEIPAAQDDLGRCIKRRGRSPDANAGDAVNFTIAAMPQTTTVVTGG